MASPTDNSTPSASSDELQSLVARLEDTSGQAEERARQQAALLAFGRRASAQPELAVLMQDALALVAEVLQADLGGVGELVRDGRALKMTIVQIDDRGGHRSARSGPAGTIVKEVAPKAQASMSGYALNTASPVVTADLASEKRFTDLLLRKFKVASGLCVPLHLAGTALGVLGIYSTRKRTFTPDDVRFVETIGHLLLASIAQEKAQQERNQWESFASTALDIVEAIVLRLDEKGRLIDLNRACQRVTGFALEEVRGKRMTDVLVPPEEVELIRGILQHCKTDEGQSEFTSGLLTNSGGTRQIVWSLKVIRIGNEHAPSFALTGLDQTELMETEAELERAKERAEQATKTLEQLRSEARQQAEDGHAAADTSTEGGDRPRPFQPISTKPAKELRSSPRRAFQYRQMVAPMDGTNIPSARDFFEVECVDISAGGIAFYLERPPEFNTLAIRLGKPPAECLFAARVMRVAGVDQDGVKRYLVGCRFTGRIKMGDFR